MGQKIALKERIKCLENQLIVKDQLLTKRNASLQLAVQASLPDPLKDCFVYGDASMQTPPYINPMTHDES